jgi:ferritin
MINQRIKEMMNRQIKNELESYYIYLSMVAYFHSLNLDGMAHWMRCQAHEEMTHAMKFFDYIIDRSGSVELSDLKQLQTSWNSPAEAWESAYHHEQFITEKISELMKAIREENEYIAEPLIAWFINEQVQEEADTSKISEQVKLVNESKEGLLLLDRELGSRVFPVGSPLDRLAYQVAN